MMSEDLIELHLDAALKAGKDASCGKKQNHVTYENALKAAVSLNSSGKARNQCEPYPCPFCMGWHIGRTMTVEELKSYLGK